MHEVYHGADRVRIGFREDTVAKGENVTGPLPRPFQHVAHLLITFGAGREQRGGLEISLNRALVADLRPRRVQRNAPIHADDVAAGGRKVGQKGRRAGAEVNEWHARFSGARERPAAVRLYVGAIIARRETADPTVE